MKVSKITFNLILKKTSLTRTYPRMHTSLYAERRETPGGAIIARCAQTSAIVPDGAIQKMALFGMFLTSIRS